MHRADLLFAKENSRSKSAQFRDEIATLLLRLHELQRREKKNYKNKMKCENVMDTFNALVHFCMEEWVSLFSVYCILSP